MVVGPASPSERNARGDRLKILPPTPETIEYAAEALMAGRLVAIPTETVYGLAANALDSDAIQKIYLAKGRPANNPLIVHLHQVDRVPLFAEVEPTGRWRKLAEAFWPGPLTIVLPKKPIIPDEVTAGLPSVAIRLPKHPVTQALLAEFGGPIAAPSANPFTRLSPTRAQDIPEELHPYIELAIDGGPTEVGIESTVVDLTREGATVLRLGHIGPDEIGQALGEVVRLGTDGQIVAPGMHPRHYAPLTPIVIVDEVPHHEHGLVFGPTDSPNHMEMPDDPVGYAKILYSSLSMLDRMKPVRILVQRPPRDRGWEAVWDRLSRAVEPG